MKKGAKTLLTPTLVSSSLPQLEGSNPLGDGGQGGSGESNPSEITLDSK